MAATAVAPIQGAVPADDMHRRRRRRAVSIRIDIGIRIGSGGSVRGAGGGVDGVAAPAGFQRRRLPLEFAVAQQFRQLSAQSWRVRRSSERGEVARRRCQES